jgi:hypothetical protein
MWLMLPPVAPANRQIQRRLPLQSMMLSLSPASSVMLLLPQQRRQWTQWIRREGNTQLHRQGQQQLLQLRA